MKNFLCCFMLLAGTCYGSSEVKVKNGESVAFLGDSITQSGASLPSGYVNLVASGLKANGIDIKVIKAGISGHKSNQMLHRLERDVLKKKPTWMLLSCGVNDVMHGARGVELEPYKKNITQIVDKALAAGIKVMILTATMIREDPKNGTNKKLLGYNEFLRKFAKEKKCLLADLNVDMQAGVKTLALEGALGNKLTRDGVHMNVLGDMMMARGILRTFGLNDAQLKKANELWLKEPVTYALVLNRTGNKNALGITLTIEEVLKLNKASKKERRRYNQKLLENIQKSYDNFQKK